MPNTEENRYELISRCDINQHWSAMLGMFRGELRAWFCEIAGAQSILHQDEEDYPDTGLDPTIRYAPSLSRLGKETAAWWELSMDHYVNQVRKHCHECGVPLRGEGELAQADLTTSTSPNRPCTCGADRTGPSAEAHADDCPANPKEQCSETHASVFRPKRKNRRVELVTIPEQLGHHPRDLFTSYVER
jgi:hypothetical protein